MTTEKTIPSESQHYYTESGEPAYTVIGKNGKERNTTLRDARTMNLVPGATMIIKEAAKFGLEIWKQKQVLWAALTLPKIEGEAEADYIERIIVDSKEQSVKAAERGKQIHEWVQKGFEGYGLGDEAYEYYYVAEREIEKECDFHVWQCETPFATERYGGKCDLYHPVSPGIVLDIKTKDTPLDNVKTWDDHDMQLGAYRQGLLLPNAKCGIIFVSTKDISAKLIWIPEDKLQRGTMMFNHLLDYWYSKTGL